MQKLTDSESFFAKSVLGKGHPPGCFASGQTPSGNDYDICVIKNWNNSGKNYCVLRCPTILRPLGIASGEIWYDLEQFWDAKWIQEAGLDWGRDKWPIQSLDGYPDVAHGGNFIIIMDMDGGDGPRERHHKAVIITNISI